MDILKRETVVENGTEYEIEQYTEDGETVYATVKMPVSDDPGEHIVQNPEVTQLDRIEAQTAYIAMMMDGGDI